MSSKQWANPAIGVFVNHNGPLTDEQRDWVALLAAPPGSVLGGLSALRHDGFTAFNPVTPIVVAKRSASKIGYKDVILHWSKFLDERDVHPLRLPPRTRPARKAGRYYLDVTTRVPRRPAGTQESGFVHDFADKTQYVALPDFESFTLLTRLPFS